MIIFLNSLSNVFFCLTQKVNSWAQFASNIVNIVIFIVNNVKILKNIKIVKSEKLARVSKLSKVTKLSIFKNCNDYI